MTQEEFYLRAMLALASNPSYVQVEKSEDDPTLTTHVLQTEEIQMDADRLLKEAQSSWFDAFDTSFDSAKEHLRRIADSVSNLDRTDTEDYLKTIADAVSELNSSGIKAYVEEG